MSKRVYALITAIIGGLATIATGVVSFLQPAYTPAIISAIGVGATAILEICNLFVKPTENKN
jgi:hypothetical protein